MEKMEQLSTTIPNDFDKKYKNIVKCEYTDNYLNWIDWINKHSRGSVDIKFKEEINQILVGFEYLDDALMFKVKYFL